MVGLILELGLETSGYACGVHRIW